MKKLIYILYLLPLLSIGQMVPFGFFEDEVGCTADANEQFTSANAASDPNCNEANATTGMGSLAVTVTSATTDPQVGDYHIVVASTSETSDRMFVELSVTDGDTFDVSFKAKKLQSVTASGFYNHTNGTGTTQLFTTAWADYSVTITATATGTLQLRFYVNDATPGGQSGDEIYIDNLSIIETTP